MKFELITNEEYKERIDTSGTANKEYSVFTSEYNEGEFITFGGHASNEEYLELLGRNFNYFFDGKLTGRTYICTEDFVPTHASQNNDAVAFLMTGISTFYHMKIN